MRDRILLGLFAISVAVALLAMPLIVYGTVSDWLSRPHSWIDAPAKPAALALAVVGEVVFLFGAGVYATAYLRQRE